MKEFNNRKIAKKYAEYITGKELRQYAAEKIKKYVPNLKSIFDGAAGSGQLEEYVKPEKFVAVEIQKSAADVLKENYINSRVYNKSFFQFDEDVICDAVLMNPPFSMKLKEQDEEDIKAIQKEFPWKKSGVVDDIFLLKSLNFTKRYGFYIMFPGITYRRAELKMRELIGNSLLELNTIENAFEDTSISVIFIVIDKEKNTNTYHSELYDCKTKTIKAEQEITLEKDLNTWERATFIEEKEKIDIVKLEAEIKRLHERNIARINELDRFIKEELKGFR
nr:MAG TPA: N-6 DNA Methylase [Caudoviricetes sp.]